MLKCAILLLLACSVASGAKKCDISLIKGVSRTEIDYSFAQNNKGENIIRLECTSNDTSLMGFKFNQEFYTHITCDISKGWFDDSDKIIADASSEINMSCEQYCVATGQGIKIEKKINDLNPSHSGVYVFCPGTTQLFYNDTLVKHDTVSCSKYWHWNKSGYSASTYMTPVEFECREVAGPTCAYFASYSWYLENGFLQAEIDENLVLKLTCSEFGNSLVKLHAKPIISQYNPSNSLKSLTCDKEGGWKATDYSGNSEPYRIAEATSRVQVYCENHCQSRGNANTTHVKPIDGGNEYMNVSCKDNQDMYFQWRKLNGTSYVLCESGNSGAKWRTENGEIHPTDDDRIQRKYIQCVSKSVNRAPSCSFEEGINSERSRSYLSIEEGASSRLSYNNWRIFVSCGGKIEIDGSSTSYHALMCHESRGWYGEKNEWKDLGNNQHDFVYSSNKIGDAYSVPIISCYK